MSNTKDYIEMALKSAEGFRRGGKLNARELGGILEIAERDGIIDINEIRVLRNIISRIDSSEVDDAMRQKMAELLEKISKQSQG